MEKTYAKEAKAKVSMKRTQKYFDDVFKAMPWFMLRMFRDDKVLFVLTAGDTQELVEVDLFRKQVALIGQSDRRHAGIRYRFHQAIDPDDTVENRILGMQMQMNERCLHAPIAVASNASLTGRKLCRCAGHGPSVRSACRWATVG